VEKPSASAENRNTQVRLRERCQSQDIMPKLSALRLMTLFISDQEEDRMR
jgi:hypothetical protein